MAIQEVKKIEYLKGMLGRVVKPENLPMEVWRGAEIPADVQKAIKEEDLFSLGGVYGDKSVGDPIEYDHLKLTLINGAVEIKIFNRGITLFISDDERVRRIHRVLCKLDRSGES